MKKTKKIMAGLLCASLIMSLQQPGPSFAKQKTPKLSKSKVTVTKGKSKKIKIKNAGKVTNLKIKLSKKAKKKVSIKKSGKKTIKITGKKVGKVTAKINFKVNNKKYNKKLKITIKSANNSNSNSQAAANSSATTSSNTATASAAANTSTGVDAKATSSADAAKATASADTTKASADTATASADTATASADTATASAAATISPVETVIPSPDATISSETEIPSPTAKDLPASYKVEANIMSDMGGITTSYSESQSKMVLTEINTGDWTKVSGVNFDPSASGIEISICSETDKGSIEVYLDAKPGESGSKLITTVSLPNTGGNDKYETVSAALSEKVTGKHDLYFVFRGDGYQVADWIFRETISPVAKTGKASSKNLKDEATDNVSSTNEPAGEEGTTETLDLSNFDVQQEKNGKPVYDETSGTLSAVDVELFILDLPKTLNTNETAEFTIKGVNNGTNGFRFWLSDPSYGNNSENLKSTDYEDFGAGEFTITGTLTSNTASDKLLIKGISYGTFMDDITFSSVTMTYKGGSEIIEPKQPYQPDVYQAYDAKEITLTKSIREMLRNKSDNRVESLLVGQRFIADPTTMEYDGRLYVYGTTDEIEFDGKANVVDNNYNNHSLSCVSTDDMVNWKDEGEIDVHVLTDYATHSWAPSIVKKNIDGKDKFFIYYTTGGDGIAVLTADHPAGPWKDPIGKRLIDRSVPGCSSDEVPWLFDPGVLVDDDGTGYIYFGGGTSVKTAGRVCKLSDDMISLAEEPRKLDPSYYFEDNEINKIGDTYYYSYCTNWSSDSGDENYPWVGQAVIAYYTADNPYMENATFQGMVFPNKGQSLYDQTYNNHHHMFTYKGETYIAYHSTYLEGALYNTKKGYRSLHIDKLTVNENDKALSADWTYEGTHLTPEIIGVN